MTLEQKKLSELIGEKIHSHQIKMRPRAYFIIGAILLGAGLTFAAICSAFFIGVTIFRIRVHGPFAYLTAGQTGLHAFLITFPWIPIALALLAAALGLVVMKKFDFSYHHAFIGILVGFGIIIILMGVFADVAELPGETENAPLVQLLSGIDYDNETVLIGTIIDVSSTTLDIITPDHINYRVSLATHPTITPATPLIKGEWVRLLGETKNGQFKISRIFHQKTPYGVPANSKSENELMK